MQELLSINLPNGEGLQMPRYLAKKFYDFLKQFEKAESRSDIYEHATEWLKNLVAEDRAKIVLES